MNATFIKTLGSSVEDATIYDKEGKLERLGPFNERLRLLRTRGGGHFSFIRMSDVVNQAVYEQLEKVLKNKPIAETLDLQELESDSESESANRWAKERRAHLVL